MGLPTTNELKVKESENLHIEMYYQRLLRAALASALMDQDFQCPLEESIVKPVLSVHSKRRPKLAFKTDYRFMKSKVLPNATRGAFCNTFDLH